MRFWFGLEILRLAYKKVFFKILNSFYQLFTSKKIAPTLIKVEKKISSKLGAKGYQKKQNFTLI
jgi:hypothetical protein